ncbi:MAG: BspA family leucine-rich repeat surface protein, partial [Oscillospiraceae bacterium]|nr:BspA family leucine-rich repeat surface protein [Oscillospiraceae bacterium]
SAIKHIVITSGTKTDTKASYMFYEMDNLIDIQGLQNLDTSSATDMNKMFYGCSSIRSLDLSGFDVRNVTDMSAMFYECYALETLDVKAWNTLALQNTRYMFYNCTALGGVEFYYWDTSGVTDFSGMFAGCASLEELYLGAFDIRSAKTLDEMFIDCESLTSLDLSGWEMPGGASAADMFLGCTSLERICLYPSFTVTEAMKLDNADSEYAGWSSKDGRSGFSIISGTGRYASFTGDGWIYRIPKAWMEAVKWDGNGTLTLSGQLPDECEYGFPYMAGVYTEYVKKVVIKPGTKAGKSLRFAFVECNNLKSIEGLNNLDTSKTEDMTGMFAVCESLTSLDLSSFNMSNVREVYGWSNMFDKCNSLTSIKLPKGFYMNYYMGLPDKTSEYGSWTAPDGKVVSKPIQDEHGNWYAEFTATTAGVYTRNKPGQSPTITKIEPGNGKMTVYWTPIDNATGYTVYFTKSGGTEKSVERAASQNAAYIGGLENGTYSVYVKAIVNGKRTTVKNKATAVLKSYYVPCTTQATASGEITISWNKFSGASRYRVVCIDKNNNVRDTKTTSKLSFKWQGLKNNEDYGFYVQPYIEPGVYPTFTRTDAKDKQYIKWTCPVNSPMITKLSLGNQKVWLYYEKVPRATKYYIYYVPKGGSEKLAGTTTNTKFLVTGLKNGVATEFYVKALVDGKLTPLKRPATRTTRGGIKPTVTSSSGNVSVSWSKYTDCKASAAKYKINLVDSSYNSLGYVETEGLGITIKDLPRGVKLGVYVVPYVNGEYIPFGLSHADDKANVVMFTVK